MIFYVIVNDVILEYRFMEVKSALVSNEYLYLSIVDIDENELLKYCKKGNCLYYYGIDDNIDKDIFNKYKIITFVFELNNNVLSFLEYLNEKSLTELIVKHYYDYTAFEFPFNKENLRNTIIQFKKDLPVKYIKHKIYFEFKSGSVLVASKCFFVAVEYRNKREEFFELRGTNTLYYHNKKGVFTVGTVNEYVDLDNRLICSTSNDISSLVTLKLVYAINFDDKFYGLTDNIEFIDKNQESVLETKICNKTILKRFYKNGYWFEITDDLLLQLRKEYARFILLQNKRVICLYLYIDDNLNIVKYEIFNVDKVNG